MNYPSINEYKEAIKFAEDNFDQLKHLRPVLGEDGEPVMTSGNFAVVFKMKDEQTGKFHAVKCFLREQEGRAEAYRMIAEELEYVSSTFLTPIKYLDKELFVDTNAGDETEFPVLLMDWVEGETLDKYIRKHLDDQYELSLLAYQFSRLAMWLMPQPFAHGDLKPDNILVKSDGTLVLVDYDGMYVPAMKGQKARELGSPDFRHPSRTETDFDEHIDDFSLASILLSLKALSLQPSLLEDFGAQDRLLFSENDYYNLSESKVMDALKFLMQDAELASLYSLFILAASQNNLSGVSFRLFYLKRPSLSSPKKGMRVLQINKKIVNQSNQKIIKKELLASFQGKKNVWHILLSNGTSSYLTQEWNFDDEARAKGSCKLNTVENDKKHVLFLFNNKDAEVGRYYIGKKLQGLTPKQLTEIKHELCFFEAWNPETKKWVPCVGKSKDSVKKQKLENEDQRTEVTDEELDAWTAAIEENMPHDNERCWPLLEFAMAHGKMQVGEFANKETGEKFKSCIFTKEGTRIFVAFSAKLGELTPKEIAAMKDDLVVVQNKNGYYSLCKRNAYDDTKGIKTRLCSNGNIINRYLRVKSSNAKFGIIDIEEKYAEGSSWRTKLCYYNIFEDGGYNLSDIESIKYDKEKDIVQIDFKQLVDDRYDSIWFSRQFEKIHMEFYRHHILTMEFNSRYEKASFPLEDLFYAFCSLSLLESENAIVTLNGEAFHVKYIQNYYTEAQMRDMGPIESIRFIYEEINDENLSTEVTDEDLENAWTDEYGVMYSADRKRLLKAPQNIKEYIVRNGTLVICDEAFSEALGYTSLQSIIISDSVVKIGNGAFWDCEHLSNLKLSRSLLYIGARSFSGCKSLYEIDLPNSIIHIGERSFYECESLTKINIPNALTKIESEVFRGCAFSNISIPDSVKSIGFYAFGGCECLSKIDIPNSVVNVEDGAFSGCCSLKNFTFPKEIKEIGKEVFRGCGLTEFFIPTSVEKIGNRAFWDCNLSSITIPDSVKTIDEGAFYGCPLLSVKIPNSITKIEDETFYECFALKQVIIPNSVTEIGNLSFYSCAFTEIELPNSIVKIDNHAFNYCESLRKIDIPNSVEVIEDGAFANCYSLEAVSFPSSIRHLGDSLFHECDKLKHIYIPIGTKDKFVKLLPDYKDILIEKSDIIHILFDNSSISIVESCRVYKRKEDWVMQVTFKNGMRIDHLYSLLQGNQDILLDKQSIEKLQKYIGLCEGFYINPKAIEVDYESPSNFSAKILFNADYVEISGITWGLNNNINDWRVKGIRSFNIEERLAVSRAEVVASQYGSSVCFFMNSGGQTYIPLDPNSELSVGDELEMNTAKLITLCRKGHDDIVRVIE